MAKARKPTKAHISRAARDMHSRNRETRKEAAEVLATLPRRKQPIDSKPPKKHR
jgi:hypothetical protein